MMTTMREFNDLIFKYSLIFLYYLSGNGEDLGIGRAMATLVEILAKTIRDWKLPW